MNDYMLIIFGLPILGLSLISIVVLVSFVKNWITNAYNEYKDN